MYVCVCIHTYTYIHIHIHTHTHTYILILVDVEFYSLLVIIKNLFHLCNTVCDSETSNF